MLTDKKIRALKPRDKDYTVSDDTGGRGEGRLAIRVRPTGTKTWEYRWFEDGKKRRKSLGTFPAVPLVEARQEAAETARKVRQQSPISPAAQGTLGELLLAYVQDMRNRNKRSADEVDSDVRRLVEKPFPRLWGKVAAKVTPHDIRDVLTHHINRGMRAGSNRLRSYISTAYRYGMQIEFDPLASQNRTWGITLNPVEPVPRQRQFENQGKRVLTAGDVGAVWGKIARTARVGTLGASIVRLCIATAGQRPTGLVRLEPDMLDFDERLICQPGSITKNGKPHVIPMSQQAYEILAPLHQSAVDRDWRYLFPSAYSTIDHYQVNSAGQAIREYRMQHGAAHWTLRDIRRTAKTVLGMQKVSKEDRDRLHGHALHDVSSLHYDLYEYLDEKRAAMKAWEKWLNSALS
ncbi:tyrosine-type recombinase/integrase [Halomonas sp. IOP_31]|uniref:tyrosine-type recombinase/integrase n=1 Tax=Halomonas sp. IOP_31 TaxID=2876584 RepID=UPI001E56F3F1|nr:site-specific integrase [Halomonas sp. IOP_31]MCD6006924.1 site-specific integrase [Halomonas sp. IOP_31]